MSCDHDILEFSDRPDTFGQVEVEQVIDPTDLEGFVKRQKATLEERLERGPRARRRHADPQMPRKRLSAHSVTHSFKIRTA